MDDDSLLLIAAGVAAYWFFTRPAAAAANTGAGNAGTATTSPGNAQGEMQPLEILTRTLWGEARGESDAAISGVASVILNRAHDSKNRFPKTVAAVCLQPKQFSVWNTTGTANEVLNHQRMLAVKKTDSQYKNCETIATWALNGELVDQTQGAEWYHDISIAKPASWARLVKTVQIGRLVFYKG